MVDICLQILTEKEKLIKSTTSHIDVYKHKKQAIDLLPDAGNNLIKLQVSNFSVNHLILLN